jgi:putative sigma-54 modulation protein
MNVKGADIMRYIISGKNIDVTEGLKTAVYEKIGKLEKYFTPDTEVHVTLSAEKDRQKIEVTIPVKGNIIRAEQVSNDLYVSIDLVEEIIERQLRRYKNKIIGHKQAASNFNKKFVEDNYDEDDIIKIVKTKKFAIKPMDAEEACVQMELLGHNFFVFRNAYTDEVNVVYKRKGNTYGLIEPEC